MVVSVVLVNLINSKLLNGEVCVAPSYEITILFISFISQAVLPKKEYMKLSSLRHTSYYNAGIQLTNPPLRLVMLSCVTRQ